MTLFHHVIPAKAGISFSNILAFAGMTLLLLLGMATARAESISEVDKNLKAIEKNLTESEGGIAKLDKTLKATKSEIKRIEGDTKTIAKRIKNTETDSVKLREKLSGLTGRRDELEGKTKALKAVLAPMIQAALNMAHTPTDLNLFLADPAKAGDLLTAHVALSGASASIQSHLERYALVKEELDELELAIRKEQGKLDKLLGTLAEDRTKLSARMEQQAELAKSTESDLKTKKEDVKGLQEEREKLANLLNSLKSAEIERKKAAAARKKREREAAERLARADPGAPASPKAKKKESKPREKTVARGLPSSGYVVRRFGDTDSESGLESLGIRIEGEPNGLVTSPVSGKVRYAGEFRGLGNLVIIEDSGGDFSLLGELGRISTREGAQLSKGAPVGTLSASTNPAPQLYYELRRNGKTPVDPMRLF